MIQAVSAVIRPRPAHARLPKVISRCPRILRNPAQNSRNPVSHDGKDPLSRAADGQQKPFGVQRHRASGHGIPDIAANDLHAIRLYGDDNITMTGIFAASLMIVVDAGLPSPAYQITHAWLVLPQA